jgi:NADPH:quinone reductase-like Zn-dependent oxidoreductase
VLRFEDEPRPTPESGELLIKVQTATVNAIDWKARAGYLKDAFPLPLPYIPGWDVSGIVEALYMALASDSYEDLDSVTSR